MTQVRCPLYETALISRHEPAILTGDQVLLYHELDEMASRVARNLEALGVGTGQRVAIYMPQDWSCIAILFGLWRRGCVACLLNTRLPRAAALAQLRFLGCAAVVAHVTDDRAADLRDLVLLNPDVLLAWRESADAQVDWHLDLQAPATILFTSGTSGPPKAALLSLANHYYSARGANVNVKLASRDAWLLSLPLYHVGGLGIVFRCVLAGATIAIPESGESIERAQERYGVTHLSVVATQLYRLLRSPDVPATFESLKCILLGGGPVSADLLADAYHRRWPVVPTYGLTEMASQVCTMTPASPPGKRMSAGPALRYRRVRVSARGEIEVQGETLFEGYVQGDSLVRPVDEDGWFRTGDTGRLDADGYLTVTGRLDRMFVSGGENVHPEEIEGWLLRQPEIAEAAVVAVKDAEFGARPVAFVRWNGAEAADQVRCRLSEHLPRFKIPTALYAWPAHLEPGPKADLAALAVEAERRTGHA